ncbi:MAG: tetratricopeptide repeat protein [Anaeroplasma sp.]
MAQYVINQYRGVYKRALELYEEEKFKEAAPLFELVVANDQANFNACYYLGDLLYNGKGTPKNLKRAFQMFMTAATNKITDASYMVGLCYLEGSGINQDSTQAVAWFTEAAKYAHPLSQYYLGLAYMKGEGITKDIPRACQWLVHAAKQGVVEAQRDAGDCFETLGNLKGAATLYLAGAENGDAYCQEKIADCYAYGRGTKECLELALHYYELAAEAGNVKAQVKLGHRYSKGEGVTRDIKRALDYYNKAANANEPEAQNALAECYHLGDGIVKNDMLAISWWTKAANSGNVDAMIHLAENLTDPSDATIETDLVTAKYWWTKAAESGDAYAMFRLGDCLERGIGVSVISLEDAFKWYRLSSQNGNEDATETCKRFTKSITGKVKLKKI